MKAVSFFCFSDLSGTKRLKSYSLRLARLKVLYLVYRLSTLLALDGPLNLLRAVIADDGVKGAFSCFGKLTKLKKVVSDSQIFV